MASTLINSQTSDKNLVECTKGSEYLLDIKNEREIPLERGEEWLKIIQDAYPHIPKELIWNAIDLYTLKPKIMDDLVADCKAHPEKYKEEKKLRFADEKWNKDPVEIIN